MCKMKIKFFNFLISGFEHGKLFSKYYLKENNQYYKRKKLLKCK